MRDIAILLIVTYGLIRTVREPVIGILLWCWIGYMNPHRLSYGFAYSIPWAFMTAVVLIPSLLFSKEPKKLPGHWLVSVWLAFVVWMCITTVFAQDFSTSAEQLDKVLKIQLVNAFMMMIMGTRERLNMLLWVIVISIGFFGFKGGIFTILGGGGSKVWGPPGSFIADNNEIGLAMLTTMPLMYYLRQQTASKWVRHALALTMLMTAFAVIGTSSRGSMIAGLTAAAFLWLRSPHKVGLGLGLIVLLPVLYLFAPSSWHERMGTIETYDQDASAMGRINAWGMAFRLASNRLTGGGFVPWTPENFAKYADVPSDVHAAHSIYFGVLGDHGWPGLILFVAIAVGSLVSVSRALKICRAAPELTWLSQMLAMVQVSLIVFLVGGSFYSLAYFDLYWNLVTIVMLGHVMARRYEAEHPELFVRKTLTGRPAPPAREERLARPGNPR